MPPQPPASASQKQPPPPGLSRVRSLRRPQAGPSAAAAAAAAAKNPGSTSSSTTTSSSLPTRHVSPTRSPGKPRLAAPSASSHAAPGAGAIKPPSRTVSKPPSASRTGLLFASQRPGAAAATSAPQPGAAPRRPLSSGGLPFGSGRGLRTEPATTATTTTTRGAPSSSSTRGHARTRSTSTVTTSATSLTAATVLRPPSAQSGKSASSGGSRPPTRGASVTTSGATGPTASSTHRRQISATTTRLEERSAAAAAAAAASAAPAAAAHRPAFNNNLQHYSPAKNVAPKPRIAAILAPPASPSKLPANVALSVETARLQTALLHAHLLHRDAAAVTASWHASARRTLIDDRFAALSAAHAELAQRAARRAEDENALALLRWGTDTAGAAALEERIQTLDAVLSGVWVLTGAHLDAPSSSASSSSFSAATAATSAGRYARVARRFEQWAEQTAALVEARRRVQRLDDLGQDEEDGGGGGAASAFDLLPEDGDEKTVRLDAAWHEECAQLVRKLAVWQQQLDALGGEEAAPRAKSTAADAPPSSSPSLTRILAGCRGLVAGMLAELRMMRQLEQDAAEAERAWIRTMIASADREGDSSSGGGGGGRDRPARAGAIWRVM